MSEFAEVGDYGAKLAPYAPQRIRRRQADCRLGHQVPEPLVAQLKKGGRLVVPVGPSRESQRLVRIIKDEVVYKTEDHGACAFVPLIGQHGWST